jgi:hypothetical protein
MHACRVLDFRIHNLVSFPGCTPTLGWCAPAGRPDSFSGARVPAETKAWAKGAGVRCWVWERQLPWQGGALLQHLHVRARWRVTWVAGVATTADVVNTTLLPLPAAQRGTWSTHLGCRSVCTTTSHTSRQGGADRRETVGISEILYVRDHYKCRCLCFQGRLGFVPL